MITKLSIIDQNCRFAAQAAAVWRPVISAVGPVVIQVVARKDLGLLYNCHDRGENVSEEELELENEFELKHWRKQKLIGVGMFSNLRHLLNLGLWGGEKGKLAKTLVGIDLSNIARTESC